MKDNINSPTNNHLPKANVYKCEISIPVVIWGEKEYLGWKDGSTLATWKWVESTCSACCKGKPGDADGGCDDNNDKL